MLWSLVVVALIAPEVILTAQTLLKIRSAKARHAKRHVERAVLQGGICGPGWRFEP